MAFRSKKKQDKLNRLLSKIEQKRLYAGKDFDSLSEEERQKMIQEGLKSMGKAPTVEEEVSQEPEMVSKPKAKKVSGIKAIIKAIWGSEI